MKIGKEKGKATRQVCNPHPPPIRYHPSCRGEMVASHRSAPQPSVHGTIVPSLPSHNQQTEGRGDRDPADSCLPEHPGADRDVEIIDTDAVGEQRLVIRTLTDWPERPGLRDETKAQILLLPTARFAGEDLLSGNKT